MILIAVTIATHVSGVVLAALGLRKLDSSERLRVRSLFRHSLETISVIVSVALFLVAMHAFECALWAGVYLHLDAIRVPQDAMLYSIDSMTTRGGSGVALPRAWLVMGAIESINGLLLFGISTAFLFAVMHRRWMTIWEPK